MGGRASNSPLATYLREGPTVVTPEARDDDSQFGGERRVRVQRQSPWRLDPVGRAASFEISIANPNCAGKSLAAQIHWAGSRFDRFVFSIGDLLNAYTYRAIGHPRYGKLEVADAEAIATSEGDEWLHQNSEIIRATLSKGTATVVRWADWLQLSEVQTHIQTLSELSLSSEAFRIVLERETQTYLGRRGKSVARLAPPKHQLFARYLIEELAVYQYQSEHDRAVHIYPGNDDLLRRLARISVLPASLRATDYALLHISR